MTQKDILFTVFISTCLVLGMVLIIFVGRESEIEIEEYKDLYSIIRSAQHNHQADIVKAIVDATQDKQVTISEYQQIKAIVSRHSMHESFVKNELLKEVETIKPSLE